MEEALVHHQYSIEQLIHYRCGSCQAWWSVADRPPLRNITCPYCSAYGVSWEMKDMSNKVNLVDMVEDMYEVIIRQEEVKDYGFVSAVDLCVRQLDTLVGGQAKYAVQAGVYTPWANHYTDNPTSALAYSKCRENLEKALMLCGLEFQNGILTTQAEFNEEQAFRLAMQLAQHLVSTFAPMSVRVLVRNRDTDGAKLFERSVFVSTEKKELR